MKPTTHFKLIILIGLALISVAAGYSTKVDQALRKMITTSNGFDKIIWRSGQETRYEDIGSSGGTWGSISGTVSDQTDLQSALDSKLDKTGGTVTGNINVTGAITCPDGSGIQGVIAEGLSGSILSSTDTVRIMPGTNKDLEFYNAGSSATKIQTDTGTLTLNYVPQVFAWTGTETTQAGTTTEGVLGRVTVPGGMVGKRGNLLCTFALVSGTTTNYGQNPQLYVYDGVGTSTLYELNNSTSQSYAIGASLFNKGSTTANVKYASTGAPGNFTSGIGITSVVPFAIDTRNPLIFTLTHHHSFGTTTEGATTILHDLRVITTYAD